MSDKALAAVLVLQKNSCNYEKITLGSIISILGPSQTRIGEKVKVQVLKALRII